MGYYHGQHSAPAELLQPKNRAALGSQGFSRLINSPYPQEDFTTDAKNPHVSNSRQAVASPGMACCQRRSLMPVAVPAAFLECPRDHPSATRASFPGGTHVSFQSPSPFPFSLTFLPVLLFVLSLRPPFCRVLLAEWEPQPTGTSGGDDNAEEQLVLFISVWRWALPALSQRDRVFGRGRCKSQLNMDHRPLS